MSLQGAGSGKKVTLSIWHVSLDFPEEGLTRGFGSALQPVGVLSTLPGHLSGLWFSIVGNSTRRKNRKRKM